MSFQSRKRNDARRLNASSTIMTAHIAFHDIMTAWNLIDKAISQEQRQLVCFILCFVGCSAPIAGGYDSSSFAQPVQKDAAWRVRFGCACRLAGARWSVERDVCLPRVSTLAAPQPPACPSPPIRNNRSIKPTPPASVSLDAAYP